MQFLSVQMAGVTRIESNLVAMLSKARTTPITSIPGHRAVFLTFSKPSINKFSQDSLAFINDSESLIWCDKLVEHDLAILNRLHNGSFYRMAVIREAK